MTSKIERNDHLVTLHRETIEATGMTCSQCSASKKHLHVFYTMRGINRRTHNGQFCNKLCHDIFHGLKPASSKDHKHHD